MMQSMTGFGKATREVNNKKITVEIRSLNSKQLDLNLRVHYAYKEKEQELRNEVSKQIERGKVDVTIYFESVSESTPVVINKPLAKIYYKELKSLSQELEENNQSLLEIVLKMPDVFKAEKEVTEFNETEWKTIKETFGLALDAFRKFRQDEGSSLYNEFITRINNIDMLLSDIINLDSLRVPAIKTRIKNNLEEVIQKEQIDNNRLEQEMIYYIEKLDITEEKLRLKTHLDYFKTTINETSSGRKLGFISQEIGREINTIGSKANDASIQKRVVEMKDELEKVKEQLLNVL